MTLCPECVHIADADLIRDRIAHGGVPKDEDTKWALNYNQLHKAHSKPAPKTKGRK